MTRAERAKIFHFVYVVYDEVLFFGELDKSKAQTFLLIFLYIIYIKLGASRYTLVHVATLSVYVIQLHRIVKWIT